eukprot:Gb_36565 [translate_table: standard]
MSTRRGPPKHQNKFAWKADAGCKKNETELGGKLRPYSEITGVCGRCKDQIEWKRKYGKYKPIIEPAKCNQCGKRVVRQAYHTLCSACAKQRGVCAKCSHTVDNIVGRDEEEVEVERKKLEDAIKHSRERERRTLLRAMNMNKPEGIPKSSKNIKKELQDSNSGHHSDSSDNDDDSDEETDDVDADDDSKSESGKDIDEGGGDFKDEVEKQGKRLDVL